MNLLLYNLSNFESFLQNDKDIFSHYKIIQSLIIEMFKIENELITLIMGSMFEKRNEFYKLRNIQEFLTERKITVHYGLETLSYWSKTLSYLLIMVFSTSKH